MTWE